MKNRENFDRVGAHAIDQAVRRLDQLADLHASEFRDDAARLRKLARLIKPARDAVDELLGVDRRGEADVLSDGGELGDGVLRPAGARALRGAADARADARERFVVAEDAAGVGVGEAGLDGLADVDLVGEVVPGG